MDFLKQWTICICMTLVVAVILSLLTPSSTMGRFYKMLISIFIFLSFVYPFSEFEVSSVNFEFDAAVDEYENTINHASQTMIKDNILSVLKNNSIIGVTVDVDTYVDNDLICIDSILVTVPDEYDTQMVKNIIFENLSLNVEVVHIAQ